VELILASGSPRRQAILAQLGFEFRIVVSHADENLEGLAPLDAPAILAERKALEVSLANPSSLVLGFDTLVFLDGQPLGKPESKQHAHDMLCALRGREHQVCTGVAIFRNGDCLFSGQEKERGWLGIRS